MSQPQNAVCIIPARGGSKRLPGKNLRPLCGKPLIAYTVEAAVHSGCFRHVFVSSDDADILAAGERYGALTDVRSPEMSADTVKAVEVVAEFLARMQPRHGWDAVAMCLPTCPARTASDVRAAMELFQRRRDECPRLVGVTGADRPQLALKSIGEDLLDMREPEAYAKTTRSQDMDRYYLPNGSIYAATMDEYLAAKTFFGRPMLTHVLPEERSFDIDYEYQFEIAEHMMRRLGAG